MIKQITTLTDYYEYMERDLFHAYPLDIKIDAYIAVKAITYSITSEVRKLQLAGFRND